MPELSYASVTVLKIGPGNPGPIPRGVVCQERQMRDLTNWTGCPAPKPVTLEGRYVRIEPYDRAGIWKRCGRPLAGWISTRGSNISRRTISAASRISIPG